MGTPEFARIILERLHKEGYPIIAVLAQPDKPAGRGKKLHSSPVALYAREQGLALYQPFKVRDLEVVDEIVRLSPDYIVVAAYGKILPVDILDASKKETLNVHASLLPEYRGAAPINYALLKGKDKTGISIIRLIKEMDAGPVFLTKEINIDKDDDAITLTDKLARLGAETIVEALKKIHAQELKPTEQDADKATFSPKLTRELSPIDWKRSALEITNQIRALLPWPVACTTIDGKVLKIYTASVLEQKSQASPGTLTHIAASGWTVATGSTDMLIKEVQLEGKKRMNAFDLANGLRLQPGKVLD